MVAGPTAEARTEAGLTGAAGDTHTAVARTEVAAGRVTQVAADRILARAGRAAAAGAAAAADLEADDRRVRGRAARDPMEAADTELADTAAVHRALRADIHPVRVAAVLTAERVTVTDTEADTDLAEPATATAGTQETPVRTTGTMGTTAVTAEALALRDQEVRTAAAILVRGRAAPTETRTQTRVTDAALTVPHRIAAAILA
jgi:hypothetical protein